MSKLSILAALKVHGSINLGVNLTEYPVAPDLGTIVLKSGALSVFTTVDGVTTWYPLTRPNKTYLHTQATPALVWTIDHALGVSDIWFQAQLADGTPVFPGQYTKTNDNSFTLTFSEAISGKVIAIGTADLEVPIMRTNELQVGGAGGVVILPTGIKIAGVTIPTGNPLIDKGTVSTGIVTFDNSAKPSSIQRLQVGGALTIATAGWPAGALGTMLLELVNAAAFVITWPTIRWVLADGTYTTTFSANTVTLQAAGTDFVNLWSRDGGATVYGKVIR